MSLSRRSDASVSSVGTLAGSTRQRRAAGVAAAVPDRTVFKFPKPAKGEYRAAQIARSNAVKATEDRAKLAAKVREGYRCRVPGCTWNLQKWRLESAHLADAGMGGNPDGSRGSERRHYVAVCFQHHQGRRSMHSGDLRAVPLDPVALGDGLVRFEELTEGGWVPLGLS